MCCLVMATNIAQAQPNAPTQAVPPGSVVTAASTPPSPSAQGVPAQQAASAPATAPLPMPAGFIVVSTNHLDQVSATAKTAIDAATASESNLIRMLSIAGAVIGIGLAIAAFFGFREFKDFQKHLLRMRLTVRRSNQQLTELKFIQEQGGTGITGNASRGARDGRNPD